MMKKSIFKRLFITYGITIAIGFGILALMLLKLFDQYFIENKKQLLLDYGRKITREVAVVLYLDNRDETRLINDLRILNQFLNARIWVVDKEGSIFIVSDPGEEMYLGESIAENRLNTLAKGNSIVDRGNFDGKLKELSLTVGYPIFVNNRFSGGVLVHASLPEVQKTSRGMFRLTMWVMLLSVLIAYVILYIQIRRISNPLKEISEAAKTIAGGEFQKRLKINTQDEIEELGASFNHMAESLEKIEENRRNLVANISHDLRSPMTSIRGFVEGILDGTIPEEKHEHYLKVVLEESRRLIKITNDLLELSNMQQGKTEIRKSTFELNEVIRRELISFEKRISEKQLDVSLVIHEEKTHVVSDPVLLERALANLLDNAVKFTPQGGQLSIRTWEENDRVQLEMMNTGTAIDSEELKRIWERFHKGDSSRGEYRTGFGLGLAIVKEIISKLEERIRVESGKDFVKFIFTIKKA